jgi:hypothetical protein
MSTLNIIGWTILVVSWIIPYFFKDKKQGRLTGLILNVAAFVIFIASLISQIGA